MIGIQMGGTDKRTSAARIVPTLALCVLGACFAFEATTPLVAVGGTNIITTVEILIVLVVAAWPLSLLKARRQPFVPSLVSIPILAWCAVLLASTVLAPSDMLSALRFTARMIAGILIAWMCFDTARTSPHPTWIASSLAAGGGLVALFGIAEALNLPGANNILGSFKYSQTRVGDLLRVSSTLSYATITAMVLEMTFPLLLAWFITSKRIISKILIGVLGLVSLAVLVLTLSRGGVIALGAALVVVIGAAAMIKNRTVIAAGITSGMALAVLTIAGLVMFPETGLRVTSENDQTWYRAEISAPRTLTANPGAQFLVPVSITNMGDKTWAIDSDHPYALGYHLNNPDGSTVTYDGARTTFGGAVAPGQTIQLQAVIFAPAETGSYVIEWDVVQNEITWFSWKGSQTVPTRFEVSGSAQTASDIHFTPPPKEVNTLPAPGRLQLWSAALSMFRAHPVLGVGPDNFRLQYGNYAGVSRWNKDIHANNLYLELLADTGVIGFAIFVWLAWRILSLAASGLRAEHTSRYWLWRIALLASLTAWFVHGLLDFFFEFTPTYVAFWMITGLAVGLAMRDLDEHRNTGIHADRI